MVEAHRSWSEVDFHAQQHPQAVKSNCQRGAKEQKYQDMDHLVACMSIPQLRILEHSYSNYRVAQASSRTSKVIQIKVILCSSITHFLKSDAGMCY